MWNHKHIGLLQRSYKQEDPHVTVVSSKRRKTNVGETVGIEDLDIREAEILQDDQVSLSTGFKTKTLTLVLDNEFETVQLDDNPTPLSV